MQGIIVASGKRSFDCYVEGKIEEFSVESKIFEKYHPVPGDNVLIDQQKIISIFDRENEVFKYSLKNRSKQVIASNIDYILYVASIESPSINYLHMDKCFARSYLWNIPFKVILTKMDLYQKTFIDELINRYEGVDIYELSSIDKDYTPKYSFYSYADLKSHIANKKVIFMGESGVGKSELIFSLTEQAIKRGVLSYIQRGMNTTTQSKFYITDKFWILDSPGFSELSMIDLTEYELLQSFYDLQKYFVKCKFNNCNHHLDNKYCSLFEIKNPVIQSRLQNYLVMLEEIRSIPSWKKNIK